MPQTDGRQVEAATTGVDPGNNTPSMEAHGAVSAIFLTIDGGGMKTHGQYALPYHGLKEQKRPSSAPGAMRSERVLPRSS